MHRKRCFCFFFSFLSLIFIIIFFFFFSLFSILERNTRHRYLIVIIHKGVHPSSIITNEKENQKSQQKKNPIRNQAESRSGQVRSGHGQGLAYCYESPLWSTYMCPSVYMHDFIFASWLWVGVGDIILFPGDESCLNIYFDPAVSSTGTPGRAFS